MRNLRAPRGPLATWTAWVAPKTLKPAEAAEQVGMSEAELRDVNRIPPRMLVKAGSTLLVPRSRTSAVDVSEHLADNATMALAPDTRGFRRVTFRAGTPRRQRGRGGAALSRAAPSRWRSGTTSASDATLPPRPEHRRDGRRQAGADAQGSRQPSTAPSAAAKPRTAKR